MQNCVNVVSLPESFCRLSNLKKLKLNGNGEYMKLASLPERFGQLGNLRELNMEYTAVKELPEGIMPHILPPSAPPCHFGPGY